MFVIPVPFSKEHKAMLAHCKEVLENGMIAIHPKHNKLITALRTAEMINNEQAKAESAGAKLEQPLNVLNTLSETFWRVV